MHSGRTGVAVEVVRRSARGILLDTRGQLLLIKRTRPGQSPYCTAPGGGVEAGESLPAALVREIGEELGAEVEVSSLQQVFLASAVGVEGVEVQHFFVGRLLELHPDRRAGPELEDPARGGYELARIDLAGGGLEQVALKPDALKAFLLANREALLDLAEGTEQLPRFSSDPE